MDVEHQRGRLLQAVPEDLLEHERDITHQVDRIVPDQHDPWPIGHGHIVGVDLADLDRNGRWSHADILPLGAVFRRPYDGGPWPSALVLWCPHGSHLPAPGAAESSTVPHDTPTCPSARECA